jgi:hypothetical protein
MKILVVCSVKPNYMSDLVIHGLVSDSNEIYSSQKKPYLLKSYPNEKKLNLYGKGFTYSGLIDDSKLNVIDHKTITERIAKKKFDLIVFTEPFSSIKYFIRALFLKQRIVVIDTDSNNPVLTKFELLYNIMYSLKNLKLSRNLKRIILVKLFVVLNKKKALAFFTRYFLNEKCSSPIQFSIPREKIINSIPDKKRLLANLIPGVIETYTYDNEKDYYKMYQESYFAITHKKFGWDSLRHYEIIANGCIPYFPDIKSIPIKEMQLFPKELISKTNELYLNSFNSINNSDLILWEKYLLELISYAREYLTTEYLAKYLIIHAEEHFENN